MSSLVVAAVFDGKIDSGAGHFKEASPIIALLPTLPIEHPFERYGGGCKTGQINTLTAAAFIDVKTSPNEKISYFDVPETRSKR